MLSAPHVFGCLWKVCHGRGAPLAHPQERRRAFNVSERIENSKVGGTPASGEGCSACVNMAAKEERKGGESATRLGLLLSDAQKKVLSWLWNRAAAMEVWGDEP